MKETIVGYITSVLFHNEDNGYAVVRISSEEFDKPIIATGSLTFIEENQTCRFYGQYVDHPKYGIQFQIESFEKIMPTDKEAVVRYLSSPLFPGVGAVLATKIYEVFGDKTIEVISDDLDALLSVPNISKTTAENIFKTLNELNEKDRMVKFFIGHGLGLKDIAKVIAVYKEDAIRIVESNPYDLISTIEGIGFKKVDQFAKSLGLDHDNEMRVNAGIIHGIKNLCFTSGSTFTNIDLLVPYVAKNLQVDEKIVLDCCAQLVIEGQLINENERLYEYKMYKAEVFIAATVNQRLAEKAYTLNDDIIDVEISKFENEIGIQYGEKQKIAIHQFIQLPFSILTGGPGTGKTTVVRAIIKIYQNLFPEKRIAIVAPTGRAAKRISELTGLQAFTIHSLLKWDLHSNRFEVNALNPLEIDVLVIDEFSMVDTLLFYHLLDASPLVSKIFMIGDDQQLPPVSPGCVLFDLLGSKLVPTVLLDAIFRQSENSGIIQLAHQMRNHRTDIDFKQFDDIVFKQASSYNSYFYIEKYIDEAIKKGYTQDDIQVLSPMYSGSVGIDRLNELVQSKFNPADSSKAELKVGHRYYRIGDKVLQLKNRPDDDVYNGDIGVIVDVIEKHESDDNKNHIIVDYDGQFIDYTNSDFITMTHAYCMSIHKSQGNEFKIVIIPICLEHLNMLTKKLIYTGITRAKNSLVLVGSLDIFYEAQLKIEKSRQSYLKERIIDYHLSNTKVFDIV